MQKQEQIVAMFDEIAPSYDKANRILSFGIDTSWRKKAIDFVLKNYDQKELSILDVACGTGDMIAAWQEGAKKNNKIIRSIQGLDPSEEMLKIAQEKFPNIQFIKSFAQDIPFDDQSCDILSISYGIRNVSDRSKALAEFARVLKKGGICLILEFSKRQKGGFISFCRDFYLEKILPKLGKLVTANKAAYEYLPNSIESFLSKDELVKELEEAGFKMLKCQSFSLEISTMFVAVKP